MSTGKINELKILVVGDENIGKTTLLFTYFKGKFTLQLDLTLTGVNLFRKEREQNTEFSPYAINCWDVAGHDRFHELFPILTSNIDAVIVVIEKGQEDSISKWTTKLFDFLSEKTNRFLIALVKQDRPIDKSESYQLYSSTMKYNFKESFVLNSSDTKSVNETFEKIILNLMDTN